MKNYLLYALLIKQVSKPTLLKVDTLTNSIFDLIITEKRNHILSQTTKISSLEKTIKVLGESRSWLEEEYIIHRSILVGFGGAYSTINDLFDNLSLEHTAELNELENDLIKKKIKKDYKGRLLKIKSSYNLMEIWLQKNKTIILSELILVIILKKEKNTKKELLSQIIKYLLEKKINLTFSEVEVMKTVDKLTDSGYLNEAEGIVYFPDNMYYETRKPPATVKEKHTQTTKDYLVSVEKIINEDSRETDILKKRLEGLTLNEIGENLGITRERVRQIQNKTLKKFGKIYEVEKYREIFEEYKIERDSFLAFYKEREVVYQILNLTLKKGEKNFESYINESNKISKKEKMKILFSKGYFLNRFDEILPLQKIHIFEDILSKFEKKYFTFEEFLNIYLREVTQYNFSDSLEENIEFINVRGIVERSKYTLSTFGKKFRYYDTDLNDEDLDIIKAIFLNFDSGIYSTEKFFNEYKSFMEYLEIYDEYELHNLFKKRENYLPSNVVLNRSPEFSVGNIDKKSHLQKELISFSGETVDIFVSYLYEEFGLKTNTMKAYISSNFRGYIDGKFIVQAEEISEKNLEILKSYFTEIFYLKKEAIRFFEKENINFSTYILEKVGYYLVKDIVYKKKYGNGYAAFLNYAKNEDRFILTDSDLHNNNEFKLFIYRAESSRELIALTPSTYMTKELLTRKGIPRQKIDEFIKDIYNYIQGRKYFSFKQIKNEGFYSSLLDYEFEDFFYERLITTSTQFFALTRKSPIIYSNEDEKSKTVTSFIIDELENFYSGVDVQEFARKLSLKFHVEISPLYIIEKIQRENYFYSKELQKIFWSKEDYYDFIFK